MPAFLRRDNPAGERGRPIRTGRPDRPVIHPPSVALRVAMFGVLTIVLVGMIIFRLWFLQVLSGQQFVAEANDNRLRSVKVVAPRGTIRDRHGEVLVDNRPGLAVGIRPMDVPGDQVDDVVVRLAKVLHMRPQEIRRQLVDRAALGDPVLEEINSSAADDAETENGGDLWQTITKTLGVPSSLAERRAARRQELWQQIVAGDSSQYELVVLKEDTPKAVVFYLREHKQSFPGVEVSPSYLRRYPFGSLAAHLLGYVNEISENQLAEPQYRKYSAGDVVGQQGLEYTYDRWLRGVDGSLRVEVDVAGRPKRVVAGGRLAEPGNDLVTSLDADVQRVAEDAILYGIQKAHENEAPSADAGAAVVLDARSGEVVAMASYPSYDPEVWVGGMSAKDWLRLNRPSANTPLISRAYQGIYATGSTFKIVDATAALEEGEIVSGTTFSCPGWYKPPGATDEMKWDCWTFPEGHGSVNLIRALTESCDVYFYNVGMLFYGRDDTALEDWAMRLGYGHTTGLDIPGENPGLVPTPDWLRKVGTTEIDKIWKPGNSINLAIGQGNLLATPLQTAVSYAAVANGGKIVRPHLGVKIVDAQGDLVQRLEPPQPKQLGIQPQNLDAVQQGLRLAASAPAGTSSAVFGGYPIPVAGKTGTAEVLKNGRMYDYAWYASYAPADDPRYIVVVMIEKGGHGGSAAAPAARMIYDELFHVKSARATGTTNSD